MVTSADILVLPFASKKKWAAWLAKEHTKSTGVWLKLAKKGLGVPLPVGNMGRRSIY